MLVRNPIDIGLVIRERRRKLDLDQETLARRVKVSRQWIIEIEKGKPRAEIGLVLRTLAALDLALSVDPGTAASTPETDAVTSIDIDAILEELRSDRP